MSKAKLAKYQALEKQILTAYVQESIRRGAEDYAPVYKENDELFDMLVRSEMKTDRAMRKYFKELADRAIENMRWNTYEERKAGILDYLVKAFWDNEILVLKIFLTEALVDAVEAGGLYSEEELKVDVGWSRENAPAIEFLNKYTLNLSGQLTKTTKKRVLAAITTSIDNGEDRDGAIERITKVIKDKRRATTIAQTESVRAFSEGRIEVGRQVGADRKKWITAGDNKVSAICQELGALEVKPIDYEYKTITGEKVKVPPAHPNCRSGIRLYMPNEKV